MHGLHRIHSVLAVDEEVELRRGLARTHLAGDAGQLSRAIGHLRPVQTRTRTWWSCDRERLPCCTLSHMLPLGVNILFMHPPSQLTIDVEALVDALLLAGRRAVGEQALHVARRPPADVAQVHAQPRRRLLLREYMKQRFKNLFQIRLNCNKHITEVFFRVIQQTHEERLLILRI